MPEPKSHAEKRPWLESIARALPGFGGYLDRDLRRESDTLQRTWLAQRLERGKPALDSIARAQVDAARLDQLAEIDRLRVRLNTLIGRIRGAMPGYSGFFDLVQVDEALLDQVYQAEVDMMEDVEALARTIEAIPPLTDQMASELAKVNELSAALERAWDRREDLLRGIN